MSLHLPLRRTAAVAMLALATTGCAGLLGSYDMAPGGLPASEDRLRRLLVGSQAQQAFAQLQRQAPEDEMLHALYYGVLAYHAGSYAESAHALDVAAWIADDRMTKSLSRAALSVVSNDLILPYEPSRTERLMIPYYAALARLRLGDAEGAAVEARRLSLLLQRYDDERAEIDASIRATMRYVAGVIFEANGEHGDADVAFRNALAADSLLPRPAAAAQPTGAVVVVLEQGFVAHRVEQDVNVMLLPEEVYAIAHGSGEDRAAVSAFVAGRVLERAMYAHDPMRPRHGSLVIPAPERSIVPKTRRRTVCTTKTETAAATDSAAPAARPVAQRECVEREEEIDGPPYLLRIAWPVMRTGARPQSARLSAAQHAAVAFAAPADISRGALDDFERERALILARTVARSTAKLALSKGAERRLEETNEAAARLAGLLGNIGTALLERADTRSWHLLPAGVSVARIELPPGRHELTVEVGGAAGSRTLSLGAVDVEPGRVHLLPARAY